MEVALSLLIKNMSQSERCFHDTLHITSALFHTQNMLQSLYFICKLRKVWLKLPHHKNADHFVEIVMTFIYITMIAKNVCRPM